MASAPTTSSPPLYDAQTTRATPNDDGYDDDRHMKLPGCVFCTASRRNKAFKVVHEDDEFVVFKDRSPGSKVHLLAIPKHHIDNVKTLGRDDVGMFLRMRTLGQRILEDVGVEPQHQRMGFHIPPFYSVNHLHMHLLSTPIPFPGNFKYRPAIVKSSSPLKQEQSNATRKLKGFSWFVHVDQVIAILESEQTVKVSSVKARQ
ncbi:hypothetical protein OIO90_005510 [Microbotryomycetes sp. JL221]|nr:hypothetical protein OIO90_005510 [Microbotryomycetes sp. JL221]